MNDWLKENKDIILIVIIIICIFAYLLLLWDNTILQTQLYEILQEKQRCLIYAK